MKRFIQTRVCTHEKGTFSAMRLDGHPPFCVILEPPWIGNRPFVSCIPAGTYLVCLETDRSDHTKKSLYIKDVPGRTNIKMHTGNWLKDTEGCPITGEKFEPLLGESAVQESRVAYNELIRLLDGDTQFVLTIKEAY
jgi:hypothetical protein